MSCDIDLLSLDDCRYVLKTDDDAFVNTIGLLSYLRNLDRRHETASSRDRENSAFDRTMFTNQSASQPAAASALSAARTTAAAAALSEIKRRQFIVCHFRPRPRVSRSGKWGSTPIERPHPFWPPFCIGLAYVVTGELLPALYRKSLEVPFLWLDDVYVTGFLPLVLGGDVVRHVPLNSAYVGERALRNKMKMAADAENARKRGGGGRPVTRRGGNGLPGPLFSHVHNLQLVYDVWKDLTAAMQKTGPVAGSVKKL